MLLDKILYLAAMKKDQGVNPDFSPQLREKCGERKPVFECYNINVQLPLPIHNELLSVYLSSHSIVNSYFKATLQCPFLD